MRSRLLLLADAQEERTGRQIHRVVQHAGAVRRKTPQVTHLRDLCHLIGMNDYRIALYRSVSSIKHAVLAGDLEALKWVGSTLDEIRCRRLRGVIARSPFAVPSANVTVPVEASSSIADARRANGPDGTVDSLDSLESVIANHCVAIRAARMSLPSGWMTFDVPLSVSIETVIARCSVVFTAALSSTSSCACRTMGAYRFPLEYRASCTHRNGKSSSPNTARYWLISTAKLLFIAQRRSLGGSIVFALVPQHAGDTISGQRYDVVGVDTATFHMQCDAGATP